MNMVLTNKLLWSYLLMLLLVILGSSACSTNSMSKDSTSSISSSVSDNSNKVATQKAVEHTTAKSAKVISPNRSTNIVRSSVVGGSIPDFEMSLSDGEKVTLANILSQNKPVFLYFYSPW